MLIEGYIAISLDTGEQLEMKTGDTISFTARHTGVVEYSSSAATSR
ncbi:MULTISPECIES: hypothetical protein [Pseudomonas]|nr:MULTISPECIES: hypothetical protein [Pseudomonas]MDB6445538.1 hypothetical protein [Pseudomonas sp. 21TX0197]MDT8906335.1 hypothetical protein [Pseudomonas prosekii]NHN67261.1 hypothetical protein [Pseudomonas fluorescens]